MPEKTTDQDLSPPSSAPSNVLSNALSDASSHRFVALTPALGKLPARVTRMYTTILRETRQQIQAIRTNTGCEPSATVMFSVPVHCLTEPGEVGEVGEAESLKTVKDAFEQMVDTHLEWTDSIVEDGCKKRVWHTMHLLSQARIEIKNDGVAWASWAVAPSIYTALDDSEFLTPFEIASGSQLKGYTCLALFEMCARCLHSGGATRKNSTDWWMNVLVNQSQEISLDAETTIEYREWRKIKYEKILPAIKEINDKTDLTVRMQEFREGRTVVGVQFFVEALKKNNPHTETEKATDSAPDLSLPVLDVDDLNTDARNEIVEKSDKKASKNRLVDAFSPLKPPTISKKIRMAARAELMALTPKAQERYLAMVVKSMTGDKTLTINLAWKLKYGEWKNGVLLNKVLLAYIEDTQK